MHSSLAEAQSFSELYSAYDRIRFCMQKPTPEAPGTMVSEHIPLSKRSIEELLARAAELRAMAATATSQEVKLALLTLADRYAALAERKLFERSCNSR